LESGDGDKDVNMELWSSDHSWKIHNIYKQSDLVKEYFTALATCHECLVEHHPKGNVTYQVRISLYYNFFNVFLGTFTRRNNISGCCK